MAFQIFGTEHLMNQPNRAQRRQAKRNGLGDVLAKMGEAAKQRQSKQQIPEPEDLNVLPFPDSQIITDDYIEWRWEPLEGIVIQSQIILQGPATGEYQVQFFDKTPHPTLSPGQGKVLGQALIAADNHRYVWQQHVGTLIARQMDREARPIQPATEVGLFQQGAPPERFDYDSEEDVDDD